VSAGGKRNVTLTNMAQCLLFTLVPVAFGSHRKFTFVCTSEEVFGVRT